MFSFAADALPKPHLPTFHALAWNGLETIDEPRLRECTWEFYANLARCYGVDFESVLPGVLEPLVALMIRSALSNDGIAETRAQGMRKPHVILKAYAVL